jgi:hypothetical protein
MGKRTPISGNTIAAVATELAGHPLPNDRLPVYAAVMEQIMQGLEMLRTLPLKDIEPALIFVPFETRQDD